MSNLRVRTRFAPSPTGFMHLGNLRSALYTYFYAKKYQGDFILRIEDTDQKRYVEGAVDVILSTLNLAGISWDEGPIKGGNYGPYYQSERKLIYEKYAKLLIEKKEAYYCFCSVERLASLEDEHGNTRYDRHCLHLSDEEIKANLEKGLPYVIRQKMPDEGIVTFHDLLYGTIEVDVRELEDQVLLKSDKMPTYNFANVVDDHLMKVTHVTRGNEYLTSTPKYNLLYRAFGWEIPEYIHLSPIMRDETHKLSKRYGDAYFDDFLKKGYLPHAIVNYICLLGWAPKINQEKFTLDELIALFDVDGLKKSGSIFDLKKLQWFNHEYLKDLSTEDYYQYLLPFLKQVKDDETENWYRNMAALVKERLDYGAEVKEIYQSFFKEVIPESFSDEIISILKEENTPLTIESLITHFKDINSWTEEFIVQAIKNVGKRLNVKGKSLYMPCRIASTGEMHGPDLGKLLELLGQETVVKRMEAVIKYIK